MTDRPAVSNDLVIVGAGGHGREVHDVVRADDRASTGSYRLLGYLDDEWPVSSSPDGRLPVLGDTSWLRDNDAMYVLGLGSSRARARLDTLLTSYGRRPATLQHPLASLGSSTQLGTGSVLLAGARVTTSVMIGRHVHVNLNATVAHDCTVEDYVTVNPGANVSGNVSLGTGATIGSGAVVRQGVAVGAWCTVGAGAVVLEDVPAGLTVVGVPARPLVA